MFQRVFFSKIIVTLSSQIEENIVKLFVQNV